MKERSSLTVFACLATVIWLALTSSVAGGGESFAPQKLKPTDPPGQDRVARKNGVITIYAGIWGENNTYPSPMFQPLPLTTTQAVLRGVYLVFWLDQVEMEWASNLKLAARADEKGKLFGISCAVVSTRSRGSESQSWGTNWSGVNLHWSRSTESHFNHVHNKNEFPAKEIAKAFSVGGKNIDRKGVEVSIPVLVKKTTRNIFFLNFNKRQLINVSNKQESRFDGKIHLKIFPGTQYFYAKLHYGKHTAGPGWCNAPVEDCSGSLEMLPRRTVFQEGFRLQWYARDAYDPPTSEPPLPPLP